VTDIRPIGHFHIISQYREGQRDEGANQGSDRQLRIPVLLDAAADCEVAPPAPSLRI